MPSCCGPSSTEAKRHCGVGEGFLAFPTTVDGRRSGRLRRETSLGLWILSVVARKMLTAPAFSWKWPTMRTLFPGERQPYVRSVLGPSSIMYVRIADVAARLTVFGDRLRDEVGSSTFP
jgi:hypothetical protein